VTPKHIKPTFTDEKCLKKENISKEACVSIFGLDPFLFNRAFGEGLFDV